MIYILFKTVTQKKHFEINWPLVTFFFAIGRTKEMSQKVIHKSQKRESKGILNIPVICMGPSINYVVSNSAILDPSPPLGVLFLGKNGNFWTPPLLPYETT